MTTNHTPEPWVLDEDWHSVKAQGSTLADCIEPYGVLEDIAEEIAKANAQRIVDCVNAMAGIDDPEKWMKEVREIQLHHLVLTSEKNISLYLDGTERLVGDVKSVTVWVEINDSINSGLKKHILTDGGEG